MLTRRQRQHRTDHPRSAVAVVETAVVLPLFFMIVLGTIELGRGFTVTQLLNNAAREGARAAVMDGSTNTEVETMVRDFVTSAVGVDAASVTVVITVDPADGNDDPLDDLSLANREDICGVQVSLPFSEVGFLPGDYLAGADLSTQCAMRHE